MKIWLTPRASSDPDEIRAYLVARDKGGAERIRKAIETSIDTLAVFPGLGRKTDIPGVSVLPVSRLPYLVYHSVQGDALIILHIRHGARDAPRPDDLP